MPDPSDPTHLLQRLVVTPPLTTPERDVLASFGRGAEVRRLWTGQPRGRSPWAACAEGCCLELAGRDGPPGTVAWLRFLLREVLSPRAADAARRTAAAGLPGGHRVDGRVVVGEPARLVEVTASRVREGRPDDDLVPHQPRPPATHAEVVALRRGQPTDR